MTIPASTAVLEFQQISADGDFGLRILDNAICTITGVPRTAGKNVVACKLNADATSSSVFVSGAGSGGTNSIAGLDPTGNSFGQANIFSENASNTQHFSRYTGASIAGNTTQTASAWLARGTGTNNRFIRFIVGDSASAAPTNGFYSDLDLQAGTAGTVTVLGNGTATSVSITAMGAGYLVRMVGKVSSATATPSLVMAACSAAGTVSYTGSNTASYNFDHAALVTTASLSDTSFSVDTDTGWLSGDVICISSTTRAATEAVMYPLSANAGASSMTSALAVGTGGISVALTHLGTAPRQAEVINITRNVTVRSTSSTLMAYIYASVLATITFSWVEFKYLAANVVGKRGIEIDPGAVANAKSITYCSLHDFDVGGVTTPNSITTSLNLTFSNNVGWMVGGSGQYFVTLSNSITNTDWIMDSNTAMRCAGGFSLTDVGGTFTNNAAVSCTGSGVPAITLLEAAATPSAMGTFSNITTHSGNHVGVHIGTSSIYGTITNLSSWRNSNNGVWHQTSTMDINFDGATVFGNTTQNWFFSAAANTLSIKNSIVNSDPSFTTTLGFYLNVTGLLTLNLDNVDMSAGSGGGAAHTGSDISLGGTLHDLKVTARNVKWGTSPPYSGTKALMTRNSFIAQEKYQQTAGMHVTEMRYGMSQTDSTLYNTAAPSQRLTPSDATFKTESAILGRGILVPVTSGGTVNVSVYVRKSVSGDGGAYNGNQPRLIQRANAALGQQSDIVLDTMVVAAGSWEQLTGTSSSATDAGAWEFIVDCDGTVGWINVDDWVAS